jgi:hypothetical protein
MDDEAQNMFEAYASLEAEYWKEAVNSEMDSIITNRTCVLDELLVGWKPVGC